MARGVAAASPAQRWRLRCTLFSSQWPGLPAAATLLLRMLAGCAVLLAGAHAGAGLEAMGLRWKGAAHSVVVFRGVLVRRA